MINLFTKYKLESKYKQKNIKENLNKYIIIE